MQIVSFSIEKLFNTFSYHFEIDRGQKIFMITGPNGYGKTTILKIINSLSNVDLIYFYKLPFKNIEIVFENEKRLTIESVLYKNDQMQIQFEEDNEVENEREIVFRWFENDKEITRLVLNRKNLNKARRNYSYEYYLKDKGVRKPLEDHRNKDDYSRRYAVIAKEQNQEQFLLILNSISTLFLPANRIYVNKQDIDEDIDTKSMINEVAESLKNKMQNANFEYFKKSDLGNKGFIEKLLKSDKEYTQSEYEDKAMALEKKLAALRSFNLYVDKNVLPYQADKKQILSVYLDDLENKVKVYAELFKRLNLFSSLIEKKQFVNKKVLFNPSSGLRVISSDGTILDLDLLSSGEQNEIIMLYHFIFEINDGMIVLMDEPENSLHIAWQSMFLNDVKQIAEGLDVQFVVATHSPQLIGNNWDKCFDLYEYQES